MTTKQIIVSIVVLCLFAAGGVYVFATSIGLGSRTIPAGPLPVIPRTAKVGSSSTEDGTYVVQIHSVTKTPEDTSITFTHVTYFEGAEAKASAAQEVTCSDKPLEACVPTLTKNYYVRESGSPEFTAPINASTEIILRDNTSATMDDLQNLNRQFAPVFDVVITDGNTVSITEKSPK